MDKGLKGLEAKVLSQNLCVACGACASLCPYLRSWKGKVVKIDQCNLEEGRCFAYCPRTEVNLDEVHGKVFGRSYEDIEMGPVLRIAMVRAKDPIVTRKAQTGGVVSALVGFAVKEGLIQSAVLTSRDGDLLPAGRIVSRPREVLRCAGSSYISGPTLEAFNKGPWKGEGRIGMVGLPCQVLALGKMRASSLEKKTPIELVHLVIGLFCTWALDHAPFKAFLQERAKGLPVRKLNITPPPERLLEVTAGRGLLKIPVDEIRSFIRPGCGVCFDMTAELADLSVGTVEGREGWNAVIVRTGIGEDLIRRATRADIIETRPYPKSNLSHLKEASLLKKKRALSLILEKGGTDKGYLKLSEGLIKRILSSGVEARP